MVSQVKNVLLPSVSPEELERKRNLYWDRIDSNIYSRRTSDKLMPFQREGVDWLGLHPRGILADEMGLGKFLPNDTNVLTPTGWRKNGELRVGDEVIGRNGKATHITNVYPQGVKPVYRVTLRDGSSVEAGAEHLWSVNTPLRSWRGNEPVVLTTEELSNKLKDAAGNARYTIPMVEPVWFKPAVTLPIDPYVMGLLLGDGSMSQKTVRFTTADYEMVAAIKELVPNVSIKYGGRYEYRIGSTIPGRNELTRSLKRLSLLGKKSESKFIPIEYKLASPVDRLSLLQGLLDTDGHVRNDNNVEYSSSSYALIEDVQFLVESLGGTARIRKHPTKHLMSYRISVILPGDTKPFRLTRKASVYHPRAKYQPSRAIVSIEYSRDVDSTCIAVDAPDHLYVTERFIVTHNTVQALASVVGADAFPCLFITQATLRNTMERQVAEWTGMESYVMDSKDRSLSIRQQTSLPRPFFITHYEGVRAEFLALQKIEWKSIIVDEATNIKNRQAQRTKAVKALRAPRITLLSGTPLMNSPLDLWSLLNYLNPAKYSSYYAFEKRYCIMGGWQGKQVMGYKNVPELHMHTQANMKRRRKDEVLKQLKPKTYTDVMLDLPKWQRDVYNKAHNELIVEIRNDKTLTVATALAKLTRLKQIAVHPQATLGVENKQTPVKIEALDELLDSRAPGSKTLIFTKYATVANALNEHLSKRKHLEVFLLTGATPMNDRGKMEEAFQSLSATTDAVWISTIDAGGMGLTLTAADCVVFTDKDWVPARNQQAEDRAHRIGQQDNVLIVSLIARDTIEEKIEGTLERKMSLINQIVEKDGGFDNAKFTIDDIKDLLV